MHATKVTSGLFVLSGIEEEQLPIAPVTQLQQRVLVHCFACFLVVQRDLQSAGATRHGHNQSSKQQYNRQQAGKFSGVLCRHASVLCLFGMQFIIVRIINIRLHSVTSVLSVHSMPQVCSCSVLSCTPSVVNNATPRFAEHLCTAKQCRRRLVQLVIGDRVPVGIWGAHHEEALCKRAVPITARLLHCHAAGSKRNSRCIAFCEAVAHRALRFTQQQAQQGLTAWQGP